MTLWICLREWIHEINVPSDDILCQKKVNTKYLLGAAQQGSIKSSQKNKLDFVGIWTFKDENTELLPLNVLNFCMDHSCQQDQSQW